MELAVLPTCMLPATNTLPPYTDNTLPDVICDVPMPTFAPPSGTRDTFPLAFTLISGIPDMSFTENIVPVVTLFETLNN